MDDRPQPDPIEVDVTSNDTSSAEDGGRWSRRRPELWEGDAHEVIVRQSSADQPGQPHPGQWRLFAIAAIVGVIALVLGWTIGRTGGGDDGSTSSLTTPVTSEASSSSLPGETVPSAAPTTARPRRATTTTIAPGLGPLPLYFVEVDPRLAGIELSLIGLEQQHVLAELDLARQTLIRRDFGPLSVDAGSVVVGADWVVVTGDMEGRGLVVHDDGSFEQVDLGDSWQPFRQAGTDRFWRPRDSNGWGPATLFEQVDLTGRPTGAAIELPASSWPSQSDPAGGLVVEAAGDLYSVDATSISHLGSGDLIGISDDVMVTWDCDEQLRCGLFVTDRQSGDVRRLDVDKPGDELIESLHNWTGAGSQTISPDGSLCAVTQVSDDEPRLSLIDLASGAVYELGDGRFLPVVTWSPDDRFIFLLGNGDDELDGGWGWGWGWGGEGDLFAYDRQIGDVFPVLSEPVEWQAISIRPGAA